jgi:group I intron endonuclease
MIIYKTTCLITNKIYIGQDSKNRPEYLGSGTYISRAINKYGKENFIKEILEQNIESKDKLNDREIYWIGIYDSTNPKIGYNLSKGGRGSLGHKPSLETRQKMSSAAKGRVFSETTRKKLSEAHKGKHVTIQTKERLSESHKGQKPWNVGKTYKQKNPIYSISEDKKLKITLTLKNKPKIQCPHCGIQGSPSAIKHWHFDRCRHKK